MTCSTAITPDSPKTDSLIMEDEHLDTIPETESDEFIKSSVEDLVQNPSESEDERECDVPDCDDSQTTKFSMFSNSFFDEIIPLVMTNQVMRSQSRRYLMASLKIDFRLDEFTDELTRLQLIPPGIDNINLDPEGDILFLESLLYDNSSPRPPESFQDNSNTIIESLPTFPIPVEDSDSLREEIDIFSCPDDTIPPGIESDDFDSEDDNNSTSLPKFDSFHVDYPNSGDSTINVVEDIPVDVPNILPTHPALLMDFDFIPSINDLGLDLTVYFSFRK
ncbi:hypothetical protein Tco_1090754 [Tanacetum coccineum]|uniref:Uncharacterized protein n=1 Tax=Tanacetum coccineum TaxID=301880 RepID=A0ABQ5I545_9ASTR